MDTSTIQVNVDSPRLLRSVTKKLQQQATSRLDVYRESSFIFF